MGNRERHAGLSRALTRRGPRWLAVLAALAVSMSGLTASYGLPVGAGDTTQALTWAQQPATIGWGGTATIKAVGQGTGAVTYGTTTPSTCTVTPDAGSDPATATLTIAPSAPDPGATSSTCTYTATIDGDETYAVATANADIEITRTSQTITFDALDDVNLGDPAITLTATATSELLVEFGTESTACAIAGDTLTISTSVAGPCEVVASQPGNGTYAPAAPVSRTFQVTAPTPEIPTDVWVTLSGNSAEVHWTNPPNNEFAPITGYLVTASPGGRTCSTDSYVATTCTVDGLGYGTTYSFTVVSRSDYGDSDPSALHDAAQSMAMQDISQETGCAVDAAGGVHCWGYNGSGVLTVPEDLPQAQRVAVATTQACALLVTGGVRCWGDGVATGPAMPDGLDNIVKIVAGNGAAMCALTSSHRVACWGYDGFDYYQPAGTIPDSTDVTMSVFGICILAMDKHVSCWGRAGRNGRDALYQPAAGDPTLAVQIDLHYDLLCAVTTTATVKCWGANDGHQLEMPTDLRNVTKVAAGVHSVCALQAEGRLVCWGDYAQSQFPAVSSTKRTVRDISVGHAAVCAFMVAGDVLCQGTEGVPMWRMPQVLAHGTSVTPLRVPGPPADVIPVRGPESTMFSISPSTTGGAVYKYRVSVAGGTQFCEVLASAEHLECAISGLENGATYSFIAVAINDAGASVAVRPMRVLTTATYYGSLTCAVTVAHTVRCWDFTASSKEVAIPTGLTDVVEVAVMATRRVCAVKSDHSATCWNSWDLTDIQEVDQVTHVAAAYAAACFVTTDATVTCVGSNDYGAMDVPAGLTGVTAITGTLRGMCAIAAADAVTCWGSTPTPSDLPAATAVAGSDLVGCAVVAADGSLTCWSSGSYDWSGLLSNEPTGSFSDVSMSRYSACAIRSADHTVSCWGGGGLGALDVPADLGPVTSLTGSWEFTNCAVTLEGVIRCWGFLGGLDVPTEVQETPGDLPGQPTQVGARNLRTGLKVTWTAPADDGGFAITGYRVYTEPATTECTAGPTARSCTITSGLTLGEHYDVHVVASNEIGPSRPSDAVPPAALHPSLASPSWGCTLDAMGTVSCYGDNFAGRATAPADMGPATDVSVGETHACARLVTGLVRCWGYGDYGKTDVPGDLGAVDSISVSGYGSCAIQSSTKELRCWGNSPNWPSGLGPVATVSISNGLGCAVLTDHTMTCWGYEWDVLAAVPDDLTGVHSAVVAGRIACAVMQTGVATCWGEYGTQTLGLYPVDHISRGGLDICAVGTEGGVECIGRNDWSQHDFDGLDVGVSEVSTTQGVTCLAYADKSPTRCFGYLPYIDMTPGSARDGSSVTRATAPQPATNVLAIAGSHRVHVTWSPPSNDGGSDLLYYDVWIHGRSDRCRIQADAADLSCEFVSLPDAAELSVSVVAVSRAGTSAPAHSIPFQSVHVSLGDVICGITTSERLYCWTEEWALPKTPGDVGQVRDVAISGDIVCAVRMNGTVRCFNARSGSAVSSPSDLAHVVSIEGSYWFACALLDDDTVRCWNNGGDYRTDVPEDLGPVRSLRLNNEGACVLQQDGVPRCWIAPAALPASIPTLRDFDSSNEAGCWIDMSGAVSCWGQDHGGRVTGVPSVDQEATQVWVGDRAVCAQYEDATVNCWGDHDLYYANLSVDDGPMLDVDMSWRGKVCAVRDDNVVFCIGAQSAGTTPRTDLTATPGTAPRPPTNVQVTNTPGGPQVSWRWPWAQGGFPITRFVVTASPGGNTCEVNTDVSPSGDSCIVRGLEPFQSYTFSVVAYNEIGASHEASTQLTVVDISAGGLRENEWNPVACVVLSDGSVTCWGHAQDEVLDVPSDLPPALQVAVGYHMACALLADRTVRCWGMAGESRYLAVPSGMGPVTDIQVTDYQACALDSGGRLYCWGRPDTGLLGVPGTYTKPVLNFSLQLASLCSVFTDYTYSCAGSIYAPPAEYTHVKAISGAFWQMCIITMDDEFKCWGDYWRDVPADLGPVESFDLGYGTWCVVKKDVDHTGACWGYTLGWTDSPVAEFGSVQQITAGWGDICYLAQDSSVHCGGRANVLNPTLPSSFKDPVGITVERAPSQAHVLAVKRSPTSVHVTWAPPADAEATGMDSTYAFATPLYRTCQGMLNDDGNYECTIDGLDPDTEYDIDAQSHGSAGWSSFIQYLPQPDAMLGGSNTTSVTARAQDTRLITFSSSTPDVCLVNPPAVSGDSYRAVVDLVSTGTCTIVAHADDLESEAQSFIVDPESRTRGGVSLEMYSHLFDGTRASLSTDGHTPCWSGTSTAIEYWDANLLFTGGCIGRADQWVFHASGLLTWPGEHDGTTTTSVVLRATTDDGSRLLVDSEEVLWDPTGHGAQSRDTGSLEFLAGSTHAVDAWVFNGGGGGVAYYDWSINGGSWEPIPTSAWVPIASDLPKMPNRLRWSPNVTSRQTVPFASQITLRAWSSAQAAVTYSTQDGSDCEVEPGSNIVTVTGSLQDCTVIASSAGDDVSEAALDISFTWGTTSSDGHLTPTVTTWPTASDISAGQPLSASTLTGGAASVPGTFAFRYPDQVPGAGTWTEEVVFTPTNSDLWESVTGTVSVTVAKGTPHISVVPTLGEITYGQKLSDVVLTGGSATVSAASEETVAGHFAFASPDTEPVAGTHDYILEFVPDRDGEWNTASTSVTVTTTKATPAIDPWPTGSGLYWGQALSASTLSGGTTSTPGSWAFSYPDSTTLDIGANYVEATFTPTDSSNWLTVTGSVLVMVSKAVPTIDTDPTASPIAFGQSLADSSLTGGSASVGGTFDFVDTGAVLTIGVNSVQVVFTPTDTDHYETVTFAIDVTMTKMAPEITTWPSASALVYGQMLADSALSGGASVTPGSFAWALPATVPHAGTRDFTVEFAADDADSYEKVTHPVSVTVAKATPVVSEEPTASDIRYGQDLSDSTLSGGRASVPGSFAFAPGQTPRIGANTLTVVFTPTAATDYETVLVTVALTVRRGTPEITAKPVATVLTSGQSLADSKLLGGDADVAGSFTWVDRAVTPDDGRSQQTARFVPNDTDHYTSVTLDVPVTVLTPAVMADLPSGDLVIEGTVAPGNTITVRAGGFQAGEYVVLAIASTPQVIATGHADRKGVATLTATLPAGLEVGNHTITLYAPASGVGASANATIGDVTATSEPTPEASAEVTGSGAAGPRNDIGQALLVVLVALLIALLVNSRRRPTR